MSPQSLLQKATSYVGEGAARAGRETDLIDGVCPQVVAAPSTEEGLSALLSWASAETLATAVRGGGTKLGWGGVSGSIDLLVSTARLADVVDHRFGDLTATVAAGVALDHANSVLGTHGQWLPLDPLRPDLATVGGIVAANDSGPRRHIHGAPRDLIIGVTVVRPDGNVAKAGGIVVKNVAGYDLSRLMTGAFGVLGIVVSATFKLAPVAPASRTAVIDCRSLQGITPVVTELMSSVLTPSAIELEWPSAQLLVRFESVESAVVQQVDEVAALAAACEPSCSVRSCEGAEEGSLWRDHAARWDTPGTLVKLSTLPSELLPALVWLRDECAARHLQMTAQGRAALGVVDVGLDGALAAQCELLTELRSRFQPGDGSAVIRRGSTELRRLVDPWGPIGDGLRVMQVIKRRFDPAGILNAGRGPGGL